MSLDQQIALFTASVTFAGFLAVAWQLRDTSRQRELEALVELYDINRQLLSLAFDHPKLLAILEDAQDADPIWEKRYLQMWLNQLSLTFIYLQRSTVGADLKESLERNIADFMGLANMQRHWHRFGKFYPASFQKQVKEILKEVEPHQATQPLAP